MTPGTRRKADEVAPGAEGVEAEVEGEAEATSTQRDRVEVEVEVEAVDDLDLEVAVGVDRVIAVAGLAVLNVAHVHAPALHPIAEALQRNAKIIMRECFGMAFSGILFPKIRLN